VEEIEEFGKRLENLLKYGNVRGPKRTIGVTSVSFCSLKAALTTRYDVRFFGEKNKERILGQVLHMGLLGLIKDSWPYLQGDIGDNPEIEKEVSYDLGDGWVLSGKIDLVIGEHVFEFKFLKDWSYEKIPENLDEVDEESVLNAYTEQLNAYLNMLPDAEFGHHLWIFRHNELIPWKKLKIKKDSKAFKRFLKRARDIIKLIESMENGELPKDPKPRFGWECRNCIFKSICSK
jgi:CRISPR-associated exonuclease Cas4